MKIIIKAGCLFVLNLIIFALIIWVALPNYLSSAVFFIPVILNIIATFIMYNKNTRKINITLALLIAAFLALALILGLVVFLKGGFADSVLAVCTFITVCNIAPLALVMGIYNFLKWLFKGIE